MSKPPLIIRPAMPMDEPAIVAPWVVSYQKAQIRRAYSRGGGHYAPTPVPYETYQEFQRRRIAKLTLQAKTLVAVDIEDPSFIFGWLCGESKTVHYCHVKEAFRRKGVATALLEELCEGKPLYYTHATQDGMAFMSSFGARFNPYLLEDL